MTATENETEQDIETAARPFLIRTLDAVSVAVEGRTVDVRLLAFGEIARVADPPKWDPYDEQWMPGVFDHQLNAANRLHANYEHERGIANVVGHGISLRSESDGYHASFKIHSTQSGETALELIRGGALPGVSLEAMAVRALRSRTGVVQRFKANLRGIAFCRQGAYASAQVLAIRNQSVEDEVILEEELSPIGIDPELVERCQRLGLKIPQRYQAQPAVTDTPAEAGTSEDGTRQTTETTSSEE